MSVIPNNEPNIYKKVCFCENNLNNDCAVLF